MIAGLSAAAALDRYFLETRCKILEIAANLDRIERGEGAAAVVADRRPRMIDEALQALLRKGGGRAEACQMIFSLAYDPAWKRPGSG